MIVPMCSRRRSTVATVVFACVAAVPDVSAQVVTEGRVVVERALIWRPDFAVPAAVVRSGMLLEVTGQSRQWYEVVIPESLGGRGERGVIARSQMQLLPESPEPPGKSLGGEPAPPSTTLPSAPPRSPADSRVRPAARTPQSRRAGPDVSPKGFLAVNGIYQTTSNNFSDGTAFQANAEEGRFDTNYSVKSGRAFDIAGGVKFSNAFGIGVSVSRFSRTTPAHFIGSIPHPFFFGHSRAVASDVSGLKREELAVHAQGRSTMAVGKRLEVSLFGGPSFFRVRQDAVTDFTYTESYPYDQATFTSTTTSVEKASKIGFNGGGDIAFFFTRQIGVGFTALVSKATVPIKSAGSGNADIKVGGVQAGGGLRLRF
jgi:hypothetical protein